MDKNMLLIYVSIFVSASLHSAYPQNLTETSTLGNSITGAALEELFSSNSFYEPGTMLGLPTNMEEIFGTTFPVVSAAVSELEHVMLTSIARSSGLVLQKVNDVPASIESIEVLKAFLTTLKQRAIEANSRFNRSDLFLYWPMTNQTTHDMENGIDFDMVTKMKHQVSEYALPTLTKPRIALLFSMPEKDKLMAIMSDEALNTLMTAGQEIARTARGKVTLNAVLALNDLEQILPPPVDELSSKSRFMDKRALTSLLAGVAIDLPNPGDWKNGIFSVWFPQGL